MTWPTSVILVFQQIKATKEKAMSMEDFIITVYCLIDETLKIVIAPQKPMAFIYVSDAQRSSLAG